MKTTIELSDALFKRVKIAAAARGITLRSLIEDALERAVGRDDPDHWPQLRTATYGTPGGIVPANLLSLGNPDPDDAAYLAKRLGIDPGDFAR